MVLILAGWLVDMGDVKGYRTYSKSNTAERKSPPCVSSTSISPRCPRTTNVTASSPLPVPGQQRGPPTQYIIPTGWKDVTLQELPSELRYSPEDETAVYVKEEGLNPDIL